MLILVNRIKGLGGLPGLQEAEHRFPGIEFLHVEASEGLGELHDVDAVIGLVSEQQVQHASSLRWVHSASVGADWTQSVPSLERRSIVVTNPRGAPSISMAEHAFAMILALYRRIGDLEENRKLRTWEHPEVPMETLFGKTLGLIGLGSIGSEVAKRAHGFEMRVLAIDPSPAGDQRTVDLLLGSGDLDTLLSESDVLVVTAPLIDATRNLIGYRELCLLGSEGVLCVLSRGGIVNQEGLVRALANHDIRGACVDVVEPEPLAESDPLWDAPNVIVSPHCAGRSALTDSLRMQIALDNIDRFVRNQPLSNRIV